jgi:hypothetical protein
MMEKVPIARPKDEVRVDVEHAVSRLIEIAECQQGIHGNLLDWFKIEHEISEPNMRLRTAINLDSDALIAEVKKVRGKKRPLSLAALRALREEHARTVVPAQALTREARILERQVGDLVNAAYGLSPEEVRLMWETAPPRMPASGSAST